MTDRELMQMVLDTLSMAVEPKKGKVYAFEFQPIDCAAMHLKAIEALRAALATEQDDGHCQACEGNYCTANDGCVARDNPPQREWQGLTEGETIDLALSAFELPEVSSETREKIHRDLVIAMNDQDSRLMLFAANIEAKLKEKNK